MKTKTSPAVYVSHVREAKLKIDYKLIDRLGKEYSDSESFSHTIHGPRHDFTEEQALQAVTEMAIQWVKYKRLEGYDVSAWDDSGRNY